MNLLKQKVGNKAGFTLVESLIALSINALILLLASFMLQSLFNLHTHLKTYPNTEWHLFLNQVENRTEEKRLSLRLKQELQFRTTYNSSLITYKWVGSEVRRLVDNEGYFPMLSKVENVVYSDGRKGVHMAITFKGGRTMRGYIPFEKFEESE